MKNAVKFGGILLFLLLMCRWVVAAEPGGRAIDLLRPAAEPGRIPGWEWFSEDPQAKFGDVWKLAEGVLTCLGKPLGYLYTEKDYTDFVLRLEWRWPPEKKPGSGGVLVRTTGKHKIWPKSLEAQINAGDAGDFWGLDGYALKGPAERYKTAEHPQFGKLANLKKAEAAEKPAGEWNQYEITAKGDTVTLVINGKVVNRVTGCDVTPGKVCLTAEGDEIQFRNIRLTPLEGGK